MNLVKKKLSISFYLLNPDAKNQSIVYVSLSKNYKRLRFSTGESFITSYCNARRDKKQSKKKQPFKDFLKRNTVFYLEYKSKIESITNTLLQIDSDLSKESETHTLIQIRDQYYLKAGLVAKAPEISFEAAFNQFIFDNTNEWSLATITKVKSTLVHLLEFEKTIGTIELNKIDFDFWERLRAEYFVTKSKFSNSTSNKYLSIFKQFLKYAKRKGHIKHEIDFEQLGFLDEIEPFKIALKLHEVETLANMDLSNNSKLDRVRDLFMLEILTGQRWSDVPKLMDKNNISETAITIYQQKTNEKVNIPLHPVLKSHITEIFSKYPEQLPTITNQKFNEYLKEICILAEFNQQHSWVTLTGKKRIEKTDFRYNLVSSHTGRRTFCTLALANGINAETIMKVTGHRKYDQFRDYVKVDDSDVNEAFEKFLSKK